MVNHTKRNLSQVVQDDQLEFEIARKADQKIPGWETARPESSHSRGWDMWHTTSPTANTQIQIQIHWDQTTTRTNKYNSKYKDKSSWRRQSRGQETCDPLLSRSGLNTPIALSTQCVNYGHPTSVTLALHYIGMQVYIRRVLRRNATGPVTD